MDSTQASSPVLRSACLCGAVVGAVGLLAWLTQLTVLAPPLGATAYLCARAPEAPDSAPHRIILGHTLGLLCGVLARELCGVAQLPAALGGEITLGHAFACGLALAATVLGAHWLRCQHAPAGATTVMVALGLLPRWQDLMAFEAGVLLVVFLNLPWRRASLRRARTADYISRNSIAPPGSR